MKSTTLVFVVNNRKSHYNRPVLILIICLILGFPINTVHAEKLTGKPLEKVILQLTWYHEFQFAGYYAAQLKGYYQEEGLEVEIKERNPSLLPVDAVLSGDADFGNATSDIMFLRMQGKPVVALAVIMQHSPWVLLVRADSGITVPEDLIGKTVSTDTSYRDVEIQAMFKNENIPTENMTIVRKEPGVENLINGTVDARVSYMTSQPFELQKQGFAARTIHPVNYGIDFYGDTLFTTERQIREHPQRVAAFRQASLRGWQYAMDHPEELIDYIYSTYYADPTQATVPYSREHFRFEAKVMTEDLIHPNLVEIGHMNSHRWRRIADTYAALGMVEPIDTLKGFIYDPDPEPDCKWVYWTIGIIVVILLIIGVCVAILFVFNKRLHHNVQLRTSELSQINKTLVQEVSERKMAEEKYRRLIENLRENYFFYMHNVDGIFTYISPSLTNILGYSAEEFLAHYSEYLTDNPINKEVMAQTKLSIKGIKQPPYEVEIYHKDGSIRSLQVQEVPIFDKHRKVIAVEGIAQDITELKRAEEQIRKLSRAVEQSSSIVMITDTKGIIEYVNPIFTQLTGYTYEEAIGKNPSVLIKSGKISSEVYKELWNAITSGREWHGEFCNKKKNGELYWEYASISPVKNSESIITNFIAVKEDITERKKRGKELVKAQKLESVGMLAGGIAHDFNNSLQAIMGYITMAKIRTNPDDEIYKDLEEAGKIVFQSKDLAQQLLTFSEGGEPVKDTIFAPKLIRDSSKLALSGSNLRCEFDISEDLWPVNADKRQMNQVISNLIINADQAMPEGGIIRIKAENINANKRVSSPPLTEGRYVKITIEDHGTGISQEHLHKIFDPYFTTKHKGSGLGLAITYSIIKKHDGHITVESETGVGTTFHIYLPASRKEIQKKSVLGKAEDACPEPVNVVSPELAEGKESSITLHRKVLLMDDNYVIRIALSKHLRHLKYEVETAEEGSEAIRLYKNARESGKPFDAVIMDLTIPGGMGGKEVIENLSEVDPGVRAIVMSGYANDPIMANYKKYGFSGVLPKPHEIDELDEILCKVIMEKD